VNAIFGRQPLLVLKGRQVAVIFLEAAMATEFRNILFPVDFSPHCKTVWPAVLSMSRRFDANLTLLHAVPVIEPFYAGVEPYYPIALDVESMEREARERLVSEFSPSVSLPQLQVNVHVESGDPAICISRFAEANRVDLIMMPSRGCGKFRSLLIGSVATKVLHDAHCPVWVSESALISEAAAEAQYGSIFAAVDLSPEATGIVTHALEFAKTFNAHLRLVHAVPGEDGMVARFSSYVHSLEEDAREQLARMEQQLGVDLPVCVAAGHVSEVVRHAALDHKADLVVIGRGRITKTLGRLRTNAYTIIRDATSPVLTF
jgi:nucleotide-binding universal stress UspA family protein